MTLASSSPSRLASCSISLHYSRLRIPRYLHCSCSISLHASIALPDIHRSFPVSSGSPSCSGDGSTMFHNLFTRLLKVVVEVDSLQLVDYFTGKEAPWDINICLKELHG